MSLLGGLTIRICEYLLFSRLILGVSSNVTYPEVTNKVLNTENIILTMGDINVDNNDDLEVLENVSENYNLEKKLKCFHEFVRKVTKLEDMDLNSTGDVGSEVNLQNEVKTYDIMKPHRRKKKRLKWLRRLRSKRNNLWTNKWVISKREVKPLDDCAETETVDNDLEKAYEEFVEITQKNCTAFKYTDEGKPEESVWDIIEKLFDFSQPQNCSNFTGIGISAVECLLKSAGDSEVTPTQLYFNFAYIFFIWFCIYLVVAIPLWCLKGWCCCCCRCWWCFPNKTVENIQKYITQNPPGVYVNSKGEEERYNPNFRETELYEKIKKAIAEY